MEKHTKTGALGTQLHRTRAILVDPETQTVTEVEYPHDLQKIYALIDCETIDITYWVNECSVVLDDNGLYREPGEDGRLPMTRFRGWDQAIIGKCLVIGPPDGEGESTSCRMTLDEVRARVQFSRETPVEPHHKIFTF